MSGFSKLSGLKKIPLQKMEEGKVRKKKVGRPKKPDMEYAMIRLDKMLHAKIKGLWKNTKYR